MVAAVCPVLAADVTPNRLINADKEPNNWLMNHRTYDGQRFSPLARIDKGNVMNLKLAYAVPLGGGGGNEYNQATPLAEDGFLYITDSWGWFIRLTAGPAMSVALYGAWTQSRSNSGKAAASHCGAIS
jgi:alcohol dehydrogenase (cytochrome c)